MFALQSVWTFSLVCGNKKKKFAAVIKVALAVCVFSENWYRWGAEWHCVTLSCEQKWVAVLAWPCPKSTGAWVVGMYYRLALHLTAWVWRGLGGRQDQKPLHLPSWGRGHAALLRGEPAWRPPRINMLRNSGHSRKGSSPVSTSAWECVFVVFFFFFLAYRCPFPMHAGLTPHLRLWIF